MVSDLVFHGSSSGSLLGVLDLHAPGLKNLTDMYAAGQVPFCGELRYGISKKGISWEAVSVVGTCEFGRVIGEYLAPVRWNPEVGQSNLQKLQADRRCPPVSEQFRERYCEALDTAIEIERKRCERWVQLPAEDRELIARPFPVLYIIAMGKEGYAGAYSDQVPLRSDEAVLFETIFPQQMTIHVPASKIPLLAIRATHVGGRLAPFSELQKLTCIEEDCRIYRLSDYDTRY